MQSECRTIWFFITEGRTRWLQQVYCCHSVSSLYVMLLFKRMFCVGLDQIRPLSEKARTGRLPQRKHRSQVAWGLFVHFKHYIHTILFNWVCSGYRVIQKRHFPLCSLWFSTLSRLCGEPFQTECYFCFYLMDTSVSWCSSFIWMALVQLWVSQLC